MPSHLDHPAIAGIGLDPGPRQMPEAPVRGQAAASNAEAFGLTAPAGIGLAGIGGAAGGAPPDMSTDPRMARAAEQGFISPYYHRAGIGIGLGVAQLDGDR